MDEEALEALRAQYIGKICMTHVSEPGGRVKVLSVELDWMSKTRPVANVEHMENHPYGYAVGDRGYYFLAELELLLIPSEARYVAEEFEGAE